MNSIFAVRPFPHLKKMTIKRYISFFSRQMYFQDTLLLPGQSATKARMNWLHVAMVFNFQRQHVTDENRNYQTNSGQVSYKLGQKLFLKPSTETFHLSDCRTTTTWFVGEAVCATRHRKLRAKKIHRGRKKLFRLVKCKKIKT